MTPDRWKQITDVFEAALRRDTGARAAFLNETCADDGELRREVEAMLASHDQASRFIEEPAINVAARQSGDGRSLIGQTIAHYQVLSLLGSGGMGNVYLALDTKLGRKVALKLLPEYLAGDTQRTRLFTKEARAASALNHPNIITIHEIGQLGDRYYIAMEYVEGETLRSHIHQDKTSLSKLLKYLQQVAEGLTKAHANGIVHRDLKPDNIMITRDGYAKILDFGLAKLVERPKRTTTGDSSEVATALMSPPSIPGLVMGTVGYMSPEQAQGKTNEIDHRSDIFSFGCILFEAATGRKAFEGSDVIDSLHKIIHAPTPSVTAYASNTPIDLDRIVRRCLAKDQEKRYQSIKDVGIELEELQQELKDHPARTHPALSDVSTSSTNTHAAESQTARLRDSTAETTSGNSSSAEYLVREIKQHKRGFVMAIAILLFALVSLAMYKFWPRRTSDIKLTKLTNSGNATQVAISPDGKYVAYVITDGDQQTIHLSLVDNPASTIVLIPPTKLISAGITGVVFSLDGKSIYYNLPIQEGSNPTTGYAVYQVGVLGGATKKLMDNVSGGGLLSPDGRRIVFNRREPPDELRLYVADVGGANERLVISRKYPQLVIPAAWSPDSQMVACISGAGQGIPTGNLSVVTIADGSEKVLTTSKNWFFGKNMKWLPDGSGLIFSAREQQPGVDQLWEVSYPSGELRKITNELASYVGVSLSADGNVLATSLTEQVTNLWILPEGDSSRGKPITSGKSFIGSLAWTTDNRIIFASGERGPKDISVLAPDGTGRKTLVAGDDSRVYNVPTVSTDGKTILFVSRGLVGRMDQDGGNLKLLTTSAPFALFAQMTPDGQWIIFHTNDSQNPKLFKMPANGGEPVQISDRLIWRLAISPDSDRFACLYRETLNEPYKIAILPLDGGPPLKVFDLPSGLERLLRWSNDGRAIYYTDQKEAVWNVWRLNVDSNETPTQVTRFADGIIRSFAWSRDGKWLAVSRGVATSDVVLISGFK